MSSSSTYIGVTELSEIIGITPRTIYTYRTRHPDRLPPAMTLCAGGHPRWRRATVERWLRRMETGSDTDAPADPARGRMDTGARARRRK